MLIKEMEKFIASALNQQASSENGTISLLEDELEYLLKNNLISTDLKKHFNLTISPTERFKDAYLERSHKETEEVIQIETDTFLNQRIDYFKEHIDEFLFVESKWFELLGIDAVSLEIDDVFKTYDVMLGLKQPKKHENIIKQVLQNLVTNKQQSYDLLFNQNDGIWDLNITLNEVKGFQDDFTIGETYLFIYHFLFNLVKEIETP